MPPTHSPDPQYSQYLANMLASCRNKIARFTEELVSTYKRRHCTAAMLTFERIQLHQDGYATTPPSADVACNEPMEIQVTRAAIENMVQDLRFLENWREYIARQMYEMKAAELNLMVDIKADNDLLERNSAFVKLDAGGILTGISSTEYLSTTVLFGHSVNTGSSASE
ncbi:uncharacterized protein LAJ45_03576 [Morchella importuna]|uniref:uncharacterized protein n=1 Tax=Morchella importuna TaxID=1174673 RepID=UPI001E8DAF4B|nr:uncharacterized protein LAJ45_03576 [Morchella importuna]KAH8152150.1 hypothetical protein LAJ45_03576 [Morchella importuna]